MNLEIKEATLNDIEEILILENECFKHPFTKKDLIYEISENPVAKFLLLIKDGRLAGFLNIWITFDSSTICQICIKKEERKLGLAGFLLQNAEILLKENEVETITLEVRESNTPARNFYKKNGFIDITIKPHYYSDGENAIYMMKGLI